MSRGRTIAVNLYEDQIAVLDRLAKRRGSRSGAIQHLLEEEKRRETYRELDEAYQQYEEEAKRGDREIGEHLLGAASWPEDWREGGESGRRRGRGKDREAR